MQHIRNAYVCVSVYVGGGVMSVCVFECKDAYAYSLRYNVRLESVS